MESFQGWASGWFSPKTPDPREGRNRSSISEEPTADGKGVAVSSLLDRLAGGNSSSGSNIGSHVGINQKTTGSKRGRVLGAMQGIAEWLTADGTAQDALEGQHQTQETHLKRARAESVLRRTQKASLNQHRPSLLMNSSAELDTLATTAPRETLAPPPLPVPFVDRPDALQPNAGVSSSDDVPIVGITGRAGVGKTSLAASVAHNEGMATLFRDGVLWVSIGEEPDMGLLLRKLANKVGLKLSPECLHSRWSQELKTHLRDKAYLLVLDDVCSAAHIELLAVTGRGGLILATAKHAAVLRPWPGLGLVLAQTFDIGCLTVEQGRQLLLEKLPWTATDLDLHADLVDQAVKRVGGHPLALSMMAGSGQTPDALASFVAAIKTTKIEKLQHKGKEVPIVVGKTYDESISHLDDIPQLAACFEACLLLLDQHMPLSVIARVWPSDDAHGICQHLVSRCLILREEIDGRPHLYFHELTRLYLREKNKEVLEARLQALHQQILHSFGDLTPKQWACYTATDAHYIHANLGKHLVGAGYDDLLRHLLQDYNWIWLRLSVLQHPLEMILSDFDLLPGNEERVVRLVQGALRLASAALWLNPQQLLAQILGRLYLFVDDPAIKDMLESARAHGMREPNNLVPMLPYLTAPGGAFLFSLQGHTDSVSCVDLSEDGLKAVSAGGDGCIRYWDMWTGDTTQVFHAHALEICDLALNADGQLLSASSDKTCKVWSETGELLTTLVGHTGSVTCVAWASSSQAVSGATDATLRVWDVQTGSLLLQLVGHSAAVNAVVVYGDGIKAISGGDDDSLMLWDLVAGRAIRSVPRAHTAGVTGLSLNKGGTLLVSGSDDETMRVWAVSADFTKCECVKLLERHCGGINDVAITPDGSKVISAGSDGQLRVWSVESGKTIQVLEGHTALVKHVVLSAGGQRAVSASWDNTLTCWDISIQERPCLPPGHNDFVSAVDLSKDARAAVTVSWDNTIRVWDVRRGEVRLCLTGQEGAEGMDGVVLAQNASLCLTAAYDQTLRLWDFSTGAAVRVYQGHSDKINAVMLTQDGNKAISASADLTIRVWKLETAETVQVLEGHTAAVNAVDASIDGSTIISGSDDLSMRLWDTRSGETLQVFSGHAGSVVAVRLTVNGLDAVSASMDETIRVWDLTTTMTRHVLRGHCGTITGLALELAGTRLLSVSDDHTLRLWDVVSGCELSRLFFDFTPTCCCLVGNTAVVGLSTGRIASFAITLPPIDKV